MADDLLKKYFANHPPKPRSPDAERLMRALSATRSQLRHKPPDPTVTKRPDGDKPDPPAPKPTRKKYPKITM